MESIKHKFIEIKFNEEFQTHNGVLDKTPYKPEVMIIGTFNPNTPNSNFADFFYGRNYFWPALKNLSENKIAYFKSRMPKRGIIKEPLNPTIDEIFIVCKKFKLTFADLILEVLHNVNREYQILRNDNVCFNGKIYNLIQDGKKEEVEGLEQLDEINQVNWNINNIIKYLELNPQIKTIYFTRQPTKVWKKYWLSIVNDKRLKGRVFTNIFTPSCQGVPVSYSIERLISHWLYNENDKFGRLDHDWLKASGVKPENF